MKKSKRMYRIWLALSVFSALSALFGTAALAFIALRGIYPPMIIVIPLTAHGYWGFGFYVRAASRARLYGRLAALSDEGASPELMSEQLGLTPEAAALAFSAAEKKGYIKTEK